MPSNFPTSADSTSNLPTRTTGDSIPASDNNDKNAALIAIETKLGTGASTPTTGTVLRGTGTGTSAYGQVNLATDTTGTLSADAVGDGTTNKTYTATEKTKLAGIVR